jgi:hypothetical protein
MKKSNLKTHVQREHKIRAQSEVLPIAHNPKKTIVKGLGLFIFLIGSYIIISSYLGKPIIGNVIIGNSFSSTASVAGIILEVIGISLMFIKIKN